MELFGKTPSTLGLVHFIGIGGVGMSALAEILHEKGYPVQGSDLSQNAHVKRVSKKGIKVFQQHAEANVGNAFRVVISSAIPESNPELKYAREVGLRVMHRSELLAEILRRHKGVAIAGTHGKTTTTALTFTVLHNAGLEPGVVNGGVLFEIGANACAAKSSDGYMIAEADESDGSFTRFSPDVAVITNMDAEHLEHYGDMQTIRDTFRIFANNTPENTGTLVLGVDHPEVKALGEKISKRRIISYAIHDESAHVRASNIQQRGAAMMFDVTIADELHTGFRVNMPGEHNIQNALAAICVGLHAGLSIDKIKKGLASFRGVGRRFIKIGEINGAAVIDDYAHHPVEIKSTVDAAKAGFKGKVYAVIQPHRYTRLKDHFVDFAECAESADEIIVAPVYAAGEKPITDINHTELAELARHKLGKPTRAIENHQELAKILKAEAKEDDVVLCMGAGDINAWGAFAIKAAAV